MPTPHNRIPEVIPGEANRPVEVEAGDILRLVGERTQKRPDKGDQDEDREDEQKEVDPRDLPPGLATLTVVATTSCCLSHLADFTLHG